MLYKMLIVSAFLIFRRTRIGRGPQSWKLSVCTGLHDVNNFQAFQGQKHFISWHWQSHSSSTAFGANCSAHHVTDSGIKGLVCRFWMCNPGNHRKPFGQSEACGQSFHRCFGTDLWRWKPKNGAPNWATKFTVCLIAGDGLRHRCNKGDSQESLKSSCYDPSASLALCQERTQSIDYCEFTKDSRRRRDSNQTTAASEGLVAFHGPGAAKPANVRCPALFDVG